LLGLFRDRFLLGKGFGKLQFRHDLLSQFSIGGEHLISYKLPQGLDINLPTMALSQTLLQPKTQAPIDSIVVLLHLALRFTLKAG
jgi:hypothetical protein